MGSPSLQNLGIGYVLERWEKSLSGGSFVFDRTEKPQSATYASFPSWLSSKVTGALEDAGIAQPYSHQALSWEHLRSNKNIVVATPTASGKTLCYNIPVIDALERKRSSRALYLFPTKALSRDQEDSIRSLAVRTGLFGNDDSVSVAVYDGDTPGDLRRNARRNSRIIITNPDMLHTGILPHHSAWASFFEDLEYVVVDELHSYRGVFGSHVANVLRRLRRVAAFYGSNPKFAACSATIKNPADLAQTLVGEPFELVSESGSPTGPKRFLVYNPDIVDPERGIRRSALKEAARLAGDLILEGVSTLVFSQTRRGVEIVLRYLRERMNQAGMDPGRVRGYRGGYLPVLRREIETALKTGQIHGVVATNALELGIDVGDLDAVVLAGYPGTIASLHQRAGRAGRRQDPSLAVLVASANPLDQFLAREPSYLVESSPERALVQPDNVEILLAHLRCAAFELPFSVGDRYGSLEAVDTEAALSCLVDEGDFSLSKNRFFYIGQTYPAADVSLRNVTADRFVVYDSETGEAIAEVDLHTARMELHEQAIYQHEGQTYQVEKLDLEARTATCKVVEPVYFTTPVDHEQVRVVEEHQHQNLGGGEIRCGDVSVTEVISGFKKVRFRTHENLGYGQVDLPRLEMETEAAWIVPSSSLLRALRDYSGAPMMAGLQGLGYSFHKIASLRLMCDPRDITFVVQDEDGENSEEADESNMAIFFYDIHAGGVGLADRIFEEVLPILNDTALLIAGCPCPSGCPSCVGPMDESCPDAKTIAAALAKGIRGLTSVK